MSRATRTNRHFFAHSVEDADQSQWEPLEVHLREVAELSEKFAASFNAADFGYLAGLWHDIGKFSRKFQDYLLTANGFEAHIEQRTKVDHSTAGARHAAETIPPWGQIIAYVIAGHHAGLADREGPRSSLTSRLQEKEIEPYNLAPADLLKPQRVLAVPSIKMPDNDRDAIGFQLAFFTRMLFSCLVDADFLATERFMSPQRAKLRPQDSSPFEEMQTALQSLLNEKAEAAPPGKVKECRQQVLAACREASQFPPGLFSLTVPTGGGKTLSSLAFAIDHLLKHDRSRIIYAIPFTSIIEQTANVFREVFADLDSSLVLEHHSNVDPDSQHESPQSRLAAENWDAPLVVTTNVQFFESLFAAKTSRCRKLHNLTNSIIILDEAQTLPVDRLRPCLAVLNELVLNYGCTIVLCTATQPGILHREDFKIGLQDVREIIPKPAELYQTLKRVDVTKAGTLTDDELIERLSKHDAFLTIVNTRAHAAKLYRELSEQLDCQDSVFHLSTYMCGQHRSEVISEIRQRLNDGEFCRVISTQLIEAGVDVDFPVVYRAMTGIDSIAQAAGRCNREGRLPTGDVFVFEPAEVKLIGYLKSVAQTAREIAPDFDDLLDPEAVQKYFELHYWNQAGENKWDKTSDKGVMNCFPYGNNMPFNFRTAAERFRMIEENGQTIYVPYKKEGEQLIQQLRDDGPDRFLLRKLQRYSVTLHDHLFILMRPDIEMIHDQYPIMSNPSAYDEKLGVRVDRPGYIEPLTCVF